MRKWILSLAIGVSCLGLFACPSPLPHVTPVSVLPPPTVQKPSMRLDGNVTPEHYDIMFDLDLEHASFAGDETISVTVRHPTSVIYLHAVGLSVSAASIMSGSMTQPTRITQHPDVQQIGLNLPQPLAAGPATIHIKWSAPISDKLRGLYGKTVDGRHYAFTQFEPTDARKAFPGFDEPDKKARFAITVSVDAGNTVVSNGAMVSERIENGKKTVQFKETPRLSTYLVAVAAGPLVASRTVLGPKGVPIRVFTVPGKEKLGTFALEAASEAIQRLSDYFGIPYPYDKLDLIAVPDFAEGAMENAAAITFRESDFLIDPQTAGVSQQLNVLETLTHELTHQWFGNMVTMTWWDDLWLNEAFATWVSTKIVAQWKPEWTPWDAFGDGKGRTLKKDALIATHPIRVPVVNAEEANANFDAITYTKGASVLGMLEQFLGEEPFRQGLFRYLHDHAEGNATSEDLWQALSAASGQPVESVATAWVNQPGYPLITVSFACPNSRTELRLSQERFLSNPTQHAPEQLWPVPICLRTTHEKKCLLLRERSSRVPLPQSTCSDPVLVNENRGGFYRVRYDQETLLGLGRAKLPSSRERFMLIDDADALTHAGKLPLTTALDLLQTMGADSSPYVNYRYTDLLGYLESILEEHDRLAFRDLGETLFRPLVVKFGWSRRASDSASDRLLRAQGIYNLGRLGRSPDMLVEARRRAPLYLKDRKTLDGDVGTRVLAMAALEGDAGLFDQYLARLHETRDPTEQNDLLYALVRFEGLTQRALDLTLTPDVPQQDFIYVLGHMLRFPRLQDATWKFMKDNFEAIRRKADEHEANYLIEQTGFLCSDEDAADVERFFRDPSHRLAGGDRALKEALDSIAICAAFRKTEGVNFSNWLHTHYPHPQR